MTRRTVCGSMATFGCQKDWEMRVMIIQILSLWHFNSDAISIGKTTRNVSVENDIGIDLVFGVIHMWR